MDDDTNKDRDRALLPGALIPEGVDLDELIEELLDAQQDINFAANSYMDQSLCDASALIDQVEVVLRRLSSILPIPTTDEISTFEIGEKAQWIVGMPGPELDDCEVIGANGDGTYQVKFQVFGQGPWHESVNRHAILTP